MPFIAVFEPPVHVGTPQEVHENAAKAAFIDALHSMFTSAELTL